MPSRKRSFEGDPGHVVPGGDHGEVLHRIRNMWQFANLCQWIYIFGQAARIDDALDIEVYQTKRLYNR